MDLRCEDGAADYFRDLRDDGVAEGTEAVWPIGKPISHSDRIGLIHPSTKYGTARGSHFRSNPILHPLGRGKPDFFRCMVSIENGANPLLLLGVGQKPNPVARMWSADRGSRYAMPLRVIPDRGQVAENSAKPSAWLFARATKQVCDVLHDEELRSKFANKSVDFGPKAASRSFHASASPGNRDVLARESPADDIHGNSVCSEPVCGEGSDIFVTGDMGPMLLQDGAAEGFDLAKGNGGEACALKAEGEAADPGKEVQHPHPIASSSACNSRMRWI
jgi:hypothetical protein